MKAGEFIRFASDTFSVGEPTLKQFVRHLKDIDPPMFSTGLRGRYSPDVTLSDAASLITALLATDRPSLAWDAAFNFGNLTLDDYPGAYIPEFKPSQGKYTPNFREYLVALLSVNVAIPSRIECRTAESIIEVSEWKEDNTDPNAMNRYFFSQGFKSELHAKQDEFMKDDVRAYTIRTSRSISGTQVIRLGAALRKG